MSVNYAVHLCEVFTTNESPATIAVDFGNVSKVVVNNYGAGDMYAQMSIDGGLTYGDKILINAGVNFLTESVSPTNLKFEHIDDTSWQVYIEGSI